MRCAPAGRGTRRAKGTGAAPPASRLLRIACGDGPLRGPALTPETTAAPGGRKSGQAQPAPPTARRVRWPGDRHHQRPSDIDGRKEATAPSTPGPGAELRDRPARELADRRHGHEETTAWPSPPRSTSNRSGIIPTPCQIAEKQAIPRLPTSMLRLAWDRHGSFRRRLISRIPSTPGVTANQGASANISEYPQVIRLERSPRGLEMRLDSKSRTRSGTEGRTVMPGQRSGGCEIRTREALPPTRFPSLHPGVHQGPAPSATCTARLPWCFADGAGRWRMRLELRLGKGTSSAPFPGTSGGMRCPWAGPELSPAGRAALHGAGLASGAGWRGG